MSTSKPGGNPPPGPANPYARFIPREELGTFSAWNPQTFEQPAEQPNPDVVGGVRKPTLAERAAAEVRPNMKSAPVKHAQQTAAAPAPTPQPTPQPAPQASKATPRRPIVGGVPGQAAAEEKAQAAAEKKDAEPQVNVDDLVNEARQTGYQDGYRNGLAALESYKQTQAAQMAAYMSDQVGALASDFHQRLESLEQQLAGRIAGVALELARQVVRTELQQRPEMVVDVAEQALSALLVAAKHIVLRLHPDDHGMAQAQLADILAARGVRAVPDSTITRGGCLVESDIAVVDATVEARWARTAAAFGHEAPWNGGREAQGSTEVHLPEAEQEADDWSDGVESHGDASREEGQA